MNSEILDVGILASFFAGVIAFLSPCILPLMPGYLSVVTRLSYEDLSDARNLPKFSRVFVPSLVFILGFSTVFVSLGVFSSQLGGMISGNKTFLLRIAGIFIILFGIFVMEIVKIPFLEREHKISLPQEKGNLLGTYILGLAFGLGWTPCVGPILGSILLYASTVEGTLNAVGLLAVYSLGIGIPFILIGLAFNSAMRSFGSIRRYYPYYKYAIGSGLVIIGILMFSNEIHYLNIYGQKIFDALGIDFWKRF